MQLTTPASGGRLSSAVGPGSSGAPSNEAEQGRQPALRQAHAILRSLRRAALVGALTLLTVNVSGLAALCAETSCEQDCPRDTPAGQCAPNCHFCSCSPLPTFAEPAALTIDPRPHAGSADWVAPSRAPSSPDPAGILHVPKPLFA